MSIICQNEDERSGSWGTDLMGVVVYVGRIGRCLEREHIGGFGSKNIGIWDCRGIFDGYQERVQRRRQEVNKDSRAEKVRVGRKNNGRIYTRVQECQDQRK